MLRRVWIRPLLALAYVAVSTTAIYCEAGKVWANFAASHPSFAFDMSVLPRAAILAAVGLVFVPLRIAGLPFLSPRERPVATAVFWALVCAAMIPMLFGLPARKASEFLAANGYQACPTTGLLQQSGQPLPAAAVLWTNGPCPGRGE